jgi:hypothetical protein
MNLLSRYIQPCILSTMNCRHQWKWGDNRQCFSVPWMPLFDNWHWYLVMMFSSVIIFEGNFGFWSLGILQLLLHCPGSLVLLSDYDKGVSVLGRDYEWVCMLVFLGGCCKYGWDGGLLIWHSSALRCWKVSRSLFPSKSIFPSAVHCHAKQSVGRRMRLKMCQGIAVWSRQ